MQARRLQMISFKKSGYFTLLELLIVISIMIILISVLLPALRSARVQAKTIKCMNNLKQQSLLLGYYADDHNAFFPRFVPYTTENGWCANQFITYLGISLNMVSPGYLNKTVLHCDAADGLTETWPPTSLGRSYGLNYAGNKYVELQKIMTFNKPSLNCLVCEYSGNYYNTSTNRSYLTARHKRGTNLLYIDGHVRYIPGPLEPYSTEEFWWDNNN